MLGIGESKKTLASDWFAKVTVPLRVEMLDMITSKFEIASLIAL
jgi:hypothetical protein